MSGIILQTRAIGVVNKGGGRKCKTERLGGGRYVTFTSKKLPGSDYVIFNCPACGARNRRTVREAKPIDKDHLGYRCNRCCQLVEVGQPAVTSGALFDAAGRKIAQQNKPSGIVRI
jgi:predicted RNA-binding Zn-ribbon protein involved in translation (DUF1610 family)